MLNPQILNTIMKKVFVAPYLKVVNVKNDIIATSGVATSHDNEGYNPSGFSGGFAPGRRGMFDDDYSEDYDY